MNESTADVRIRRAKHDKENPYYAASRATAQDKSVSYDALGLLNYLLSKSDNWEVRPSDLERKDCGKNKVYKVLKELIDAGYIKRIYNRDSRQRITSVEYEVYETKQPLPEKPQMENHDYEKPEMEKRDSNTKKRIEELEREEKKENTRANRATSPHSYPKQLKQYTVADIHHYYTEHTEALDALVLAWDGAMGRKVKEMAKAVALPYIDTHQQLSSVHFPTSEYNALAARTRLEMDWKANIPVTDMVVCEPIYQKRKNRRPAPTDQDGEPAAILPMFKRRELERQQQARELEGIES